MGDLHMDFHDEAFISRCIELALDWGVRHVAIGGDILDVEAFSKFGPDPENILERSSTQRRHSSTLSLRRSMR
jgi:hypothetical protein